MTALFPKCNNSLSLIENFSNNRSCVYHVTLREFESDRLVATENLTRQIEKHRRNALSKENLPLRFPTSLSSVYLHCLSELQSILRRLLRCGNLLLNGGRKLHLLFPLDVVRCLFHGVLVVIE